MSLRMKYQSTTEHLELQINRLQEDVQLLQNDLKTVLSGFRNTKIPIDVPVNMTLKFDDILLEITTRRKEAEAELTAWGRIFEAEETDSDSLDLSQLGLASLPEGLYDLVHLINLDISKNFLSALSDKFAKLRSLQSLDFSSNQISSLPIELTQLRSLRRLNLAENQITILPTAFFYLSKLEMLDLSRNRLSSLPEETALLIELNSLNLAENQFTSLPPQLTNLSKLLTLDLSKNQLQDLPNNLDLLSSLKYLDLAENQLSSFPDIFMLSNLLSLNISSNYLTTIPVEVSKLSNLTQLKVSKNRLNNIPKELKELRMLKLLDLRGNRLADTPPEIIERYDSPDAFFSYYLNHKKKSLNEIKVLVVGQGSVGKTSLINRLLKNEFNIAEDKTDGIVVRRFPFRAAQNSYVMNIWDFGGQEIMHATHQFFLTKRSLYLLVLDARLSQEENRVEYWLKIIQSFGGESLVLIVGNKTDQQPLDIDRTGLQKKYPNIVGILETSAATGIGIDLLKAEIAKQIDTLPHVRDLLPETWFLVKTKLEKLGDRKNYLTYEEYIALCRDNDIIDELSQKTLIGFLHDLGVILHFQDDPRLEALGILSPQWVTNGVYKILNSHILFQNHGKMTLSLLSETLNSPEYPADKRMFIVDIMKKFELCYDIETDKTFLIPDLLPKDEPFTGEWGNALAFQIHYNVLPSSIISRFIVRMNTFMHKTVWRSGIVLVNNGNNALVKADAEEHKIYIWVNGEEATRRDLLSVIRAEFEVIHKTIAKIEAYEYVPHPQYPDLLFPYQELLQFERDNIKEFPKSFDGKTIMVDVGQLLDGVANPNERNQSRPSRHITDNHPTQPRTVNEVINPWRSGSFYLVSFAFGFSAYFAAKSYGLRGFDILAAFGAGISSMLIIGVLQLRNDEKLADASFVTLISEFIKRFPFFRNFNDN